MAFWILAGYGFCNPPAQSLFLQSYTSRMLPWAWLAVAVGSMLATAAVGAFSSKMAVTELFVWSSAASAVALGLLLLAAHAGMRWAAFGLFVWKDIYIVVLVELFWTLVNLVYETAHASRAYGWFCAAGSAGGIVGSLAVGPIAQRWGSYSLLGLCLCCLAVPVVLCRSTQMRPLNAAAALATIGNLRSRRQVGVQSTKNCSPMIVWMMILVALVQILLTVTDYQFNLILEQTFADVDKRAGALGQVFAAINLVSLVLQLGTSAILQRLGVAATLLAIPAVLSVGLALFGIAPGFSTMAGVRIWGKSADYSLFRAAKELLYIPLTYREKTQGKALVDMLTYRLAKGGASVLVLALAGSAHTLGLTWVNGLLCAGWWGATAMVLRHRRQGPRGIDQDLPENKENNHSQ